MELNYQNVSIDTSYSTVSIMRNLLVSEAVSVNFEDAIITPNPNYALRFYYKVICPSEMFVSDIQYDNVCSFNSDPNFGLWDYSNLNFKLSKKYRFQFVLGVQNTYLIKPLELNVTFYQDGSN